MGEHRRLRSWWERRAPPAPRSGDSTCLVRDARTDPCFEVWSINISEVIDTLRKRPSKANKIRYLLPEELSTAQIAAMVGASTRWVRACRARVRRPPSRYAVLLAQVMGSAARSSG